MSRTSEAHRRGRPFRQKMLLDPGRKIICALGNASCFTWSEGRMVTNVLEQGKDREAGIN